MTECVLGKAEIIWIKLKNKKRTGFLLDLFFFSVDKCCYLRITDVWPAIVKVLPFRVASPAPM